MRARYVTFLFLFAGVAIFAARGASAGTEPEVAITSPADGTATNVPTMHVAIDFRSGVLPVEEVSLAVDGVVVERAPVMPASFEGSHVFQLDLSSMAEGPHELRAFVATLGHVVLEPFAGGPVPRGAASEPVNLLVDRTPPSVEILSPPDGSMHEEYTFTALSGEVSDAGSGLASVLCNEDVAVVSLGSFTCDVYLVSGENGVWVNVADQAGNRTSLRRMLIGVGRPSATLESAQGDEDATIELFLEGSDPAGGTLTGTIVTLPGDGELLQADGTPITSVPAAMAGDGRTVRFRPGADENGAPYASFAYTLTSSLSGLSSQQRTVSVDVAPLNDAPRVWKLRPVTDEDTPFTFDIPFEDPDLEREGDTITRYVKYNVTGSRGALYQVGVDGEPADPIVSNGFVEVAHPDGLLYYSPKANDYGTAVDGFSHYVQDAAGAYAPIDNGWIDIRSVNDAPVASDGTVNGTNADERVLVHGLNGYYSDVDPEPLSLVMSQGPANGTLYRVSSDTPIAVGEDPSHHTYYVANFEDCADPIPYGAPLDSVGFTVTDPAGESDPFTITINVAHVDTRALATGPFALDVATPGGTVEFTIAATDADGDDIRVEFLGLPQEGVLERKNFVGDWVTVSVGTNVAIETDVHGPTQFRYTLGEGASGDSFRWNVQTWHSHFPTRRDSRCGPYTTTVTTAFAPAG